ncbi:MAG: thiamine-phosphate kinase [Chitinivibrionales bacterium]|nr:thiamine-phosphate kinase [Chitinivibrionales bacterium]
MLAFAIVFIQDFPGQLMQFPSHEFKLLNDLKPLLNFTPSRRYPFGIGDDTALRVNSAGERQVLTVDTAVENVHFSLSYMNLDEIGYRAMVTNLSDCAAAGATPDAALVQVVFPGKKGSVNADFKKIYAGFYRACQQWRFPIVGGDIAAGPCWIIAITLLGTLSRPLRPLRRRGIKRGDSLWVSGCPGESAAGRAALKRWGRNNVPVRYRSLVKAHIRPVPQLALGRALLKNRLVHAAIDVSDGVGKECRTLCYENKLGLILDISPNFPSSAMVQLGHETGHDWLRWFFGGGEDYQLLFAADKRFAAKSLGRRLAAGVRRIGRFTDAKGGFVAVHKTKKLRSQTMLGWDHVS